MKTKRKRDWSVFRIRKENPKVHTGQTGVNAPLTDKDRSLIDRLTEKQEELYGLRRRIWEQTVASKRQGDGC